MIDINNILLMSIATGVVCLKGMEGKDWEYQNQLQDEEWWELYLWTIRN